MPTYEFRCPKGHEFTRFYKTISGSEMQLPCPECNAMAGRIMSVSGGLHFKGSGFYLTDYGKNAHRAPEAKKDGGEKQGDAQPATADSAKPAATGDTGNVKPKAESREPKAESREPKAESREPKAESPKPKSESPKPKSESRKARSE